MLLSDQFLLPPTNFLIIAKQNIEFSMEGRAKNPECPFYGLGSISSSKLEKDLEKFDSRKFDSTPLIDPLLQYVATWQYAPFSQSIGNNRLS